MGQTGRGGLERATETAPPTCFVGERTARPSPKPPSRETGPTARHSNATQPRPLAPGMGSGEGAGYATSPQDSLRPKVCSPVAVALDVAVVVAEPRTVSRARPQHFITVLSPTPESERCPRTATARIAPPGYALIFAA